MSFVEFFLHVSIKPLLSKLILSLIMEDVLNIKNISYILLTETKCS